MRSSRLELPLQLATDDPDCPQGTLRGGLAARAGFCLVSLQVLEQWEHPTGPVNILHELMRQALVSNGRTDLAGCLAPAGPTVTIPMAPAPQLLSQQHQHQQLHYQQQQQQQQQTGMGFAGQLGSPGQPGFPQMVGQGVGNMGIMGMPQQVVPGVQLMQGQILPAVQLGMAAGVMLQGMTPMGRFPGQP